MIYKRETYSERKKAEKQKRKDEVEGKKKFCAKIIQ